MLVRLARSASVRGRARQSLGPSFDRLGWMAPLSWASLIFGLAIMVSTAGVALPVYPTLTNDQDAGGAEATLLWRVDGHDEEEPDETDAAPDAHSSLRNINRYNELVRQTDWASALEVIRKEIRNPGITLPSYRTAMYVLGIAALGKFAEKNDVDPRTLDAEAIKYFRGGRRLNESDAKRRAELDEIMALYYSKTSRPGLAVSYSRRAFEYWKSVNNRYMVFKSHQDLAAQYSDAGQNELRDFYRRTAWELAQEYFDFDQPPADITEWIGYDDFLESLVGVTARDSDRKFLEKIWSIRKRMTHKYFKTPSFTYRNMARYFALSGHIERARELFAEAKSLWEEEREEFEDTLIEKKTEVFFTCDNGLIELEARAFGSATEAFAECIRLRAEIKSSPHQGLYQAYARALEGAGRLAPAIENYTRSIDLIENVRASYSVSERAMFFNNSLLRRPYWGLIRAMAKRAAASGGETDFFAAVRATERIRARQFGDLLDQDSLEELSAARLGAFASAMDPDTVVLDYVLTDSTIVILAFKKDDRKAVVIPYDRGDFNDRLANIAGMLADPGSAVPKINEELLKISETLLGPVRSLLAGGRRVIALQDGMMNIVPLGLLSAEAGRYRPLIEDMTIRVVPSLRFIIGRAARPAPAPTSGLFAVADPVFKKSITIAGLSGEELRAVTRGDAYLKYFQPLPGTRAEVEAITRAFKGGPVRTLLGVKATESAVKAADLSGYRYLHFATHGIIGGDIPGLDEPTLVLGEETAEDGLLKASEAAKLSLNADMTVLSACKTGSGRLVVGEGVLGIGRAFLVAGSRSVVVSLWSVADRETAALMVGLYRHLLAGAPVDEALRLAALDLRKVAPHPVFWAAFIVIGGSSPSAARKAP